MALLEISNLTVEFTTAHGPFRAVDRVSIGIDKGEVLAIVGESGSGKSVAMLAVMGLLPWTANVTADRLQFDGHDLLRLDAESRRSIIGKDMTMIFQEPLSSLNPCFTVGFQIIESLRLHLGMNKKQARNRAIELLREVGISSPERRIDSFPHQLSGGMNQRVTIQAQILDLLMKLQRETGMALVLITHSMGVVAETAERVSVQYAGQKAEEQPVADLFNDPHHPYTAALLAALPERATARKLPSIPGVVPGQFNRPSGCLFSPRCRFATDLCHKVSPPQQPPHLGLALCHYPLVDGKPQNHPGTDRERAA
jgi:dipeptide transport system ATP-binding protein